MSYTPTRVFKRKPFWYVPCTGFNQTTEPREFNLLFRTHIGPISDSTSEVYLRPETAQGIFVNFHTITTVMRKQLPFGVYFTYFSHVIAFLGIGQVGKSFRNEISPREFLFRLREFEQMELEYFCHPDEAEKWYNHWKDQCMNFCTSIGLKPENLRWYEHGKGMLSHPGKKRIEIFKYNKKPHEAPKHNILNSN